MFFRGLKTPFENILIASADRIRLSADAFIVSARTIRIFSAVLVVLRNDQLSSAISKNSCSFALILSIRGLKTHFL